MQKSNLFANDMGEFDKAGVESFNTAFGEIFKEATEGDEMISLGDSFEIFAMSVFFAVELEAEFAY